VSSVVSTLVPTIIATIVPVVISMLISAVIVAIAAVAVRARKDNDVTAIGAVPQARARMRRYRRRPRAVRRPLPLVRAARMPARQGKALKALSACCGTPPSVYLLSEAKGRALVPLSAD
jgi:hypothetical protein